MTDTERAAFLNRIGRECWEAALDRAIADCHRFIADHPGKDVGPVVKVLVEVLDSIVTQPIETIGDMQLQAKVWLQQDGGMLEAHERRLIEALAAMPPRLWDEIIVPAGNG